MGTRAEPSRWRADILERTLVAPWCPEPGGTSFAAEVGPMRLEVHRSTPGGYVRFLVLRRLSPECDQGTGGAAAGPVLLTSGSHETVPGAMQAAERAAERLAALVAGPPPRRPAAAGLSHPSHP